MEMRVVDIVQRMKLFSRFLLPRVSMRQIMTTGIYILQIGMDFVVVSERLRSGGNASGNRRGLRVYRRCGRCGIGQEIGSEALRWSR